MSPGVLITWRNAERSTDYTPHVRRIGYTVCALIVLSAVVSYARLHYVLSQVIASPR